MTLKTFALNAAIAAGLLVSAASHGYLYLHGYRHIPVIGTGFLLLFAVFGALAVLIVAGGPAWLRLAALVGALGSIGAFVLSRTSGLFGFVEHGLQPAPHAVLSVAAEAFTVVAAAVSLWPVSTRWRAMSASAKSREAVGAKD